MQTILLIHGPNLNRLGARDNLVYGPTALGAIEEHFSREARKLGYTVEHFQSNHEGALIDWIQEKANDVAGIVINPGALTHYSYALYDALLDTRLPVVEVHLSDINAREPWRKISVTAPACIAQISGKKEAGYLEALQILHAHISK